MINPQQLSQLIERLLQVASHPDASLNFEVLHTPVVRYDEDGHAPDYKEGEKITILAITVPAPAVPEGYKPIGRKLSEYVIYPHPPAPIHLSDDPDAYLATLAPETADDRADQEEEE